MNTYRNRLVAIILVLGISILPAFAQPRRANNQQTRTLITRIETKNNTFKTQLNRSMTSSAINNSRSRYYINEAVTNFSNSLNVLKQNANSNRDLSNDINDLMMKASAVDNVMRDYRFTTQTTTAWNSVKTDLDALSRQQNSNWNWNNPYASTNNLNGTYRLNASQSDDVNAIIDQSLNINTNANWNQGRNNRNPQMNQSNRMRENLRARFEVPNEIAIQRSGNSVTMASSVAPQTTIQTGSTTETLSNGRRMTNTVSLSGDRLTINSEGDRSNDFYITFEPYNNGRNLKVTRRLNLERQNETITVVSVYDKIANTANWNVNQNNNYGNNNNYPNNNNNYGNNDRFYIQNGTQLTATLNTDLSTKNEIAGQRFSMTVNSPSMYNGAIIEGVVSQSNRSGRVSGNAELGLEFQTIRLRNGATYRFEGLIDSVTTTDGKNIKIDNENAVKSGSQTTDTVVRSGVGAAIGAIIGGIAGGGKGAAIGAAIGAGAGGGSVLVQGRDDIELRNGTTFNITSSSNIR